MSQSILEDCNRQYVCDWGTKRKVHFSCYMNILSHFCFIVPHHNIVAEEGYWITLRPSVSLSIRPSARRLPLNNFSTLLAQEEALSPFLGLNQPLSLNDSGSFAPFQHHRVTE